MPGTLFVVATPIGNLEDISARALRTLREVQLIAAEDTRRTSHLLARYGIATPTTSLHAHNEGKKTAALVQRILRGDHVAIVSDAGMPVISDPGLQLVRAAIEAGVKIEPIPGPSAVTTALAVAGMPLDSFTYLGFPPTRLSDRKTWMERLRSSGGTVVFFEAPHRIRQTLTEAQQFVGDRQVVVCRELTKVHETLARGPISVVLEQLEHPKGELTVVIDIGHTIENAPTRVISDEDLAIELGRITIDAAVTRRQAIGILAKKYGRSPNAVYEAIERGRISVK